MGKLNVVYKYFSCLNKLPQPPTLSGIAGKQMDSGFILALIPAWPCHLRTVGFGQEVNFQRLGFTQ